MEEIYNMEDPKWFPTYREFCEEVSGPQAASYLRKTLDDMVKYGADQTSMKIAIACYEGFRGQRIKAGLPM